MFRRASTAASLIAVVLQMSSAGHMWLVEHSQCAEHGELVHGVPHGSEEASPENHAVTRVSAHGSNAQVEHDHCAEAGNRRSSAGALQDAGIVATAVWHTSSWVSGGTPLFEQVAPFRIAPKTSPPA